MVSRPLGGLCGDCSVRTDYVARDLACPEYRGSTYAGPASLRRAVDNVRALYSGGVADYGERNRDVAERVYRDNDSKTGDYGPMELPGISAVTSGGMAI